MSSVFQTNDNHQADPALSYTIGMSVVLTVVDLRDDNYSNLSKEVVSLILLYPLFCSHNHSQWKAVTEA